MSDQQPNAEMRDHTASARDGPALGRVTVYKLAREAGAKAWTDAKLMAQEQLLASIAPQMIRAVGSIGANIAEGYARRSARDRIRFYEYALGSNEEANSWYLTAAQAIDPEQLEERTNRLTTIRRLLLVMIRNERRGANWNSAKR